MNQFHRLHLLSGIRDSHQVPFQSDWAFALRKQAGLLLLPLFREVIICWKEENTGKRPYLTDLAKELYSGFFQNGSIRMSVHSEVEEIISKFLPSLGTDELAILRFYFISRQDEVDAIFQEIVNNDAFEEHSTEEVDQEGGRVFQSQVKNLSADELVGFLMQELGEIENILSDSDITNGLDTEAITRINEAFSDYLDIPNAEIFLIQKPIDEWDFWEKVTAEEPETIGKRVHTENGLEWVESWLLPEGSIRIKGNFLDETERSQAATQVIKLDLPDILKAVHQKLITHYGLFDSHIHYTFFTRRNTLENIVLAEGIQFFVDQIHRDGADDFEAFITIDIRRYQEKTLQEWGTQISLGIDQRHWLSEDENEEYKVWVFAIENQETHLETRFSEKQIASIIESIIENIHRCYQIDYGQG